MAAGLQSLLVSHRRYHGDDPEVMDRPGNDPKLLADDLRNLRVINRYFGGLRAIRRSISPLIDRIDRRKSIEILDLATGSGDYPVFLVKWIKQQGRDVRITAVDKNPFMVEIARKRAVTCPEITIREMDVLSLSFPDRSFDIVLCSSAIHHFSREDAVYLLAQMNRLSRVGFIVNDLNRSLYGAWIVWLYAHLVTTNPITRHDSYASLLRAFTQNELAAMSREAGIRTFTIMKQPFFRLILVGAHE